MRLIDADEVPPLSDMSGCKRTYWLTEVTDND